MQLIINDHGAYIGKRSELFYVRVPQKPEQEFAADKIEQIILAEASSISTGAVALAMEREIDIVYLDWKGTPIGRIYPCKLGGTTLTRRKQLEAAKNECGAAIVRALISAKIKNQAYFLKSLAKTRKNRVIHQKANAVLAMSKKAELVQGKIDDFRENLLGLEGYAGNIYWETMAIILPMAKRDKEAPDISNAAFNYGYGILYSEIEKACIIAGLDPYLGFFHTDRYGKPSLVLDVIEGFRQVVVDRAIVTLFAQKQMEEKDFQGYGENGKRLTKEGRNKIIGAVMERLHTKISSGDGHYEIQDIILKQSREIAKTCLEDSTGFKPFIYKW